MAKQVSTPQGGINSDSEKLHIRGASIFYHFGVLEYVVMIESCYPKSTFFGAYNEGDEEFSPEKRVLFSVPP